MSYSKKILASGRQVEVRPRTYAEWEAFEDKRLALLEELENKGVAAERAVMVRYKELRGKKLELQVKDFAGQKNSLSLGDVAEIEAFADKLETGEIPLGNSETGGAGPTIRSGSASA